MGKGLDFYGIFGCFLAKQENFLLFGYCGNFVWCGYTNITNIIITG